MQGETMTQGHKARRHTPSAVAFVGVVAVLALGGCNSPDGGSKDSPSAAAPHPASTMTGPTAPSSQPSRTRTQPAAVDRSAASIAKAMNGELSSVTKTIDLTEDTDGNNLLGRPHQYTSATVLVDKNLSCDQSDPGVDCGATIEVFAAEPDAKARVAYIDSIISGSSLFTEYDTRDGKALLRVSGDIKPSLANEYKAAFVRVMSGQGA
ncbi:hypothetical protein ACFT5B_17935 [Luteimicrobium sp. NPDC057192]|uniref:hypothetical protein n=1 Tax=Luteimicrobium sp. NPDC057192 TaxID=3346042 RepID=UPI00362D684C